MKNLIYLLGFTLIFASCGNQLCKQTISYTKATAIYGDIDEARNQVVNAAVRDIEDPGKIYIGEDFLLIGEEGEGIHVLDNSDPNNPVQINFINIHQNREFFVEGDALYAESWTDIVKYDISDLSNVRVEARADEVFNTPVSLNAAGEKLIGFDLENVVEDLDCESPINRDQVNFFSWDNELIPPSAVPSSFAGTSNGSVGTINRLTYSHDNLYVINWNDIFTISDNGSSLTVENETSDWRQMETILTQDDNLFIGTQTGMVIYSLENANAPSLTSTFEHATACDPVLPKGDVAYVTLRSGNDCWGFSNQLDVVNISNLNSPSLVRSIQMDSPLGMTVVGNNLYVGQGQNGLSVFDISNDRDPVLINQEDGFEAYDVIANPNDANKILVTGENGINQYEVTGNAEAFNLLSTIAF